MILNLKKWLLFSCCTLLLGSSAFTQSHYRISFGTSRVKDSTVDHRFFDTLDLFYSQGDTILITRNSDEYLRDKPFEMWKLLKKSTGKSKYQVCNLDFIYNFPRYYYWVDSGVNSPNYIVLNEEYQFNGIRAEGFEANKLLLNINDCKMAYIPYWRNHFFYPEQEFDSFQMPIDNNKEFLDTSVVQIIGDRIIIKSYLSDSSESHRADAEVFPSGEYLILDSFIQRIKEYNLLNGKLEPIRTYAGVTIGMSKEDIQELLPNVLFTKESVDKYGDLHDNNKFGYEVYDKNKLLMFVLFTGGNCSEIYGISPDYSVRGLNTGLTAKEICKLFPNAIIKIDELSEMEYIYLPSANVSAYFDSNSENRVGKYEKGKLSTKIINDKNAKPVYLYFN